MNHNVRPREASSEVLAIWARAIGEWPLAKIRRHQRINYSHLKRTPDLDVMQDVYRRAVEIKCFKAGEQWEDTGVPFMARRVKAVAR